MELTLDQALQKGIEAHKAGKAQEADQYYTAILKANSKHPDANHNMGVLAVGVGKVQEALPFFKTALEANPSIAQYWLSYVDALIKLNRMADAKSVLDHAKNNGMKGNDFDEREKSLLEWAKSTEGSFSSTMPQELPQEKLQSLVNLYTQGKYQEILTQTAQLLKQFPTSATLCNVIGAAHKGLGKLEEAIEAYNKALSIQPDYADAYNNMGNALKDQGKLEEAIETYYQAISIKPDYAEAHRNVSLIKKYKKNDDQIFQVQELYKRKDLSDDAKCKLSFTLAKMYEDIGKLDLTFGYLSKGNVLRKKLLKYSINQDKELFTNLRNTQPYLQKSSLDIKERAIKPNPIFILGMPRSGTTLVEQIISSHSEVTGAGEQRYISHYGFHLAIGSGSVPSTKISDFRNKYLLELARVSDDKHFVTDKMPQNFRFIPLICAALPEATIIHVKRNAAAVCWSNFRQYFTTEDLGYSYDLKDVVAYYNLYNDLMKYWQSKYNDRIYNLDYEQLTTNQEKETRDLVAHLNLTWEGACLSPHKNERSVKTASQQQVRKKVYKGSSEAWKKYEPFLNGAFDSLTSQ